VHMLQMWGLDAPFQIASPSGIPVRQWFRAAVGPADAFVSGLLLGWIQETRSVFQTALQCPTCAVCLHLQP
jgi:hypothetical protein